MFFLIGSTGAVALWLWLAPPDGLPERLRRVLLVLACLVTVGCTWGTARWMREMERARAHARDEARRVEAEKLEWIRRLREDQADLGGTYR